MTTADSPPGPSVEPGLTDAERALSVVVRLAESNLELVAEYQAMTARWAREDGSIEVDGRVRAGGRALYPSKYPSFAPVEGVTGPAEPAKT